MKERTFQARARRFELPGRSQLEPHVAPLDGRALLVDAVFNGPRGRPTGLQGTVGVELDDRQEVSLPAPNVLRLPLRWPPASDPAHIDVLSPGELDLVKFIVRGAKDEPLAVFGSTAGATPGAYLPDSEDWEDITNSLDPVSYLDSLDRQLERLGLEPDERLLGRGFFAHLDRVTNPFLLAGMTRLGRIHREDADQRRLAIESVGNELRTRVQLRCRGLDEGARTYPSLRERVFDHLKGKCGTVSRLFLGTIDQHFGDDLRAFERSFAQFANGDLRLQLPSLVMTSQPSSANFFLFGEFALMAIDFGIDAASWSRLANVMVRSQRIFAHVYSPASLDGADFFSYSGRDYARKAGPFSEGEVQALADEFQDADLYFEAAKNAARSMPGLLV